MTSILDQNGSFDAAKIPDISAGVTYFEGDKTVVYSKSASEYTKSSLTEEIKEE